jgi:hypothetical protein
LCAERLDGLRADRIAVGAVDGPAEETAAAEENADEEKEDAAALGAAVEHASMALPDLLASAAAAFSVERRARKGRQTDMRVQQGKRTMSVS